MPFTLIHKANVVKFRQILGRCNLQISILIGVAVNTSACMNKNFRLTTLRTQKLISYRPKRKDSKPTLCILGRRLKWPSFDGLQILKMLGLDIKRVENAIWMWLPEWYFPIQNRSHQITSNIFKKLKLFVENSKLERNYLATSTRMRFNLGRMPRCSVSIWMINFREEKQLRFVKKLIKIQIKKFINKYSDTPE